MRPKTEDFLKQVIEKHYFLVADKNQLEKRLKLEEVLKSSGYDENEIYSIVERSYPKNTDFYYYEENLEFLENILKRLSNFDDDIFKGISFYVNVEEIFKDFSSDFRNHFSLHNEERKYEVDYMQNCFDCVYDDISMLKDDYIEEIENDIKKQILKIKNKSQEELPNWGGRE